MVHALSWIIMTPPQCSAPLTRTVAMPTPISQRIAQWNLARLAETLLPLIDADNNRAIACATEVVNAFSEQIRTPLAKGMRAKLGIFTEDEADLNLANGFLTAIGGQNLDYTLAFRYLADAASGDEQRIRALLFGEPSAYDLWSNQWRERLARDTVEFAARASDAAR